MAESFWSIPETGGIRTPLVILREQARALTEATKGKLEGKLLRTTGDDRFVFSLDINVPSLNGYRYRVLQVDHGIELYPLAIKFFPMDKSFLLDSEESFVEKLKELLASEQMRRVIAGLMAQITGS